MFIFSVCSRTKAVHGRCFLLILIGSLLLATSSQAEDESGFGRELSDEEVNLLPKHVFADGTGLPEGSGDAELGKPLYEQYCADCHGSVGQGGRAVELVGDRELLATDIPDKGIAVFWPYAPTLFEYIRRAMPPEKPYSLTVNEVYSVVAHLLELNALVEPGESVDAEFLSNLNMPNRDGFRSQFD